MRTPITLKIKFKSGSLDQFIERYSVDVSRGGIFIRTKEPLAVGTQLKFEFQLQDASSLIAGEGTVVWIREHDPTRTGVAPGMGVRFDRLQPTSQQVLDKILTEKSKRGDAQMESRFDAGVRASATASGTVSTPDKTGAHNDFSGGDSKSQTPLPAPVPGLDAHDEFAEESTRVMQNEIVQALADKTRQEPSFDNEPTRKASKEDVDLLASASTKSNPEIRKPAEPAKVEAAPAAKIEAKPEPKVEPAKIEPVKVEPVKVESIRVEKELPKEDKPAAAAPAKDAPKKEPAKEPERQVAIAASAPAPRRSSAAVPVFIIVALLAAGGAYYAFRGGGEPVLAPGTSDKPIQALHKPPIIGEQLPVDDKPAVAPNDKPIADKPAVATNDKPAVAPNDKPAVAPADKPAVAPTDKPAAGVDVTLTSDPPGAQVMLDGKANPQVTPTTLSGLDLKKVYEVRFVLKGFHEYKLKLKPKAGDKINAALVPNEKLVEVSSTPAGADVMLDGKKVGKTPFTIHKVDVSKSHALEIKHVGFVAQSRSISASDAFESKGDKDVLALELKLDPEPKPGKNDKPTVAVHVPHKGTHKADKPTSEDKPQAVVEKPQDKPADTAVDKPADKPVVEKPVDKPADKPVVEDKPEKAVDKPEKAVDKPEKAADKPEKPAADKPAVEKPADKPAVEKPADKPAAIKTPSWLKSKGGDQPAGDNAPPPAQ